MCREDLKVSCRELDELVEAALQVDGVFGSRLTGAGFGGCTVTLLLKDKVEEAVRHMKVRLAGNIQTYCMLIAINSVVYEADMHVQHEKIFV